MRSILLAILFTMVLPSFASAEQMHSLNYDSPKHSKPLYVSKTEEPQKKEEPAEKVWEHYKSLAAGQPTKAKEEQMQAKAEEPPPAPKASGFAALLQQYNENKKSRGGMRSMDVK